MLPDSLFCTVFKHGDRVAFRKEAKMVLVSIHLLLSLFTYRRNIKFTSFTAVCTLYAISKAVFCAVLVRLTGVCNSSFYCFLTMSV